MSYNAISVSDFYCTKCGRQGLPIIRSRGKAREPGHLKKLYCPYCKKQHNMVEVRPFGQYKYEDFLIEFTQGNFDEEGQRINPSWRGFIANHQLQEVSI